MLLSGKTLNCNVVFGKFMADTSPSADNSDPNPLIEQNITGDRNQIIGQVLGGIIIYYAVTNNYYAVEADPPTAKTKDPQIGANPYKGLSAFQETDGDRFFGRDSEIKELWNKFFSLHKDGSATRLLTIYGPSGSGKSSLVRAGLIPKLAREPLSGREYTRVAVLVPGTRPLESLGLVLARIATNDDSPVEKGAEFKRVLEAKNKDDRYEGLCQIANALPKIESQPLIVVVDQLEELFTLCEDPAEREAFIGNLLYATADQSKRVAAIVTLSSDFLGKAQQYSLDKSILKNGLLVMAMDEDGLRKAIEEPAKLEWDLTTLKWKPPAVERHLLDTGTVNLLIEQTKGRKGTLPLLQFALQQLWVGLQEGQDPATTFQVIGGVTGALAEKAQLIYDRLKPAEQEIARRVFLGLVQLGEGVKDTRRRTELSRLISHRDSLDQLRDVIGEFAHPDERLITLSNNGREDNKREETAEVTHEALFENWQQLKDWLNDSRDDLPLQRRLDEAAMIWKDHGKPEGNLWRSPNLDLLRDFHERAGNDLTPLQLEFFQDSIDAEKAQKQAEEKAIKDKKLLRQILFGVMSTALVLTSGTALFAVRQSHIANIERNSSLSLRQMDASPINALMFAMEGGQELEDLVSSKFSPQDYPTMHPVLALQTILDKIQLQNEINTFQKDVNSIAFDKNLTLMATADGNGKIKLWNKDGSQNKKFQVDLNTKINSVRFSPDDTTIAIAGDNGFVRIWDLKTTLWHEFNAHPHSGVRNIRFGNKKDSDLMVTSGHDGNVKLWSKKDKLPKEPIKSWLAHPGGVEVVTLSKDDNFLLTGGNDKVAKLWDRNGKLLAKFTDHKKAVKSVRFSPNSQEVITASEDDTIKRWDRDGSLNRTIKAGQGGINSVEYYDSQLITAGNNGTIKIWDLQSDKPTTIQAHNGRIETMRLNKDNTLTTAGQKDGIVKTWKLPDQQNQSKIILTGHTKSVNSVRFSPDNKLVVTASSDGTVKLWDFQNRSLIKTFPKNIKANHGIETVRFIYRGNTRLILTGGEKDSLVRIWNLEGQLQNEFNTDQGGIHSISINKNYLSTTGYDRSVKLWKINIVSDPDNSPILEKRLQHKEHIKSSRFSPNGKFVAVAGDNGMLRVWRVDTKEYLDREKHIDLTGNQGNVNSIGFSPNGEMLAAVGADDKIRIWSFSRFTDLPSDKPQIIDTPFNNLFQSVNFSPDGKLIATTTEDGKVQFWTLSGQKLADFKTHSQKVRSADFSSDGVWFATASEDKKVMISQVRTLKELLDQGCEWLQIHLESNATDRKRLPRCNKSSEH
jgi:WD40 repeat protein